MSGVFGVASKGYSCSPNLDFGFENPDLLRLLFLTKDSLAEGASGPRLATSGDGQLIPADFATPVLNSLNAWQGESTRDIKEEVQIMQQMILDQEMKWSSDLVGCSLWVKLKLRSRKPPTFNKD
ncbi:hypothetical protein EUGRSUZ_C00716 [Eucalyptus grandis]|uniref:Uncharacterized protein n=2 Tax=Eucalyptus grandis TaxID=71139 RepID=A0ACC3LBB4_EUCGR|nr:hypothetical protein EUGRSUZ_C00716 [Eucalyptus grandis]